MLQWFQNIRPSSALLVFSIALFLRIPAFVIPNYFQTISTGINFSGEFGLLLFNNIYFLGIGSLLLTFLQALYINKLCIDHEINYAKSYLPAYVFILFNSIYPQNLLINAVQITNSLILLGLGTLFQLYNSQKSNTIFYFSTVCIAVSIIIIRGYFPLIFFLPLAAMMFKSINIRDIISGITALISVLIVYLSIAYILNFNAVQNFNFNLILQQPLKIIQYEHIPFLILFSFTIVATIKIWNNYFKNNIKTRRINLTLIIYFVFAILILLIHLKQLTQYFIVISPAAAVFVAYFLLGSKLKRLKELLNVVFLLAIVFGLYYPYLL